MLRNAQVTSYVTLVVCLTEADRLKFISSARGRKTGFSYIARGRLSQFLGYRQLGSWTSDALFPNTGPITGNGFSQQYTTEPFGAMSVMSGGNPVSTGDPATTGSA